MDILKEINLISVVVRLVLAILCGMLFGQERARSGRPVGMRTCALICAGAALMSLTSVYMSQQYGGDPLRIAAQIVSGVGFLGAGAILTHKGHILGITTAATIWIVAGIGIACGAGFYLGAIAGTVLMFLALLVIPKHHSDNNDNGEL